MRGKKCLLEDESLITSMCLDAGVKLLPNEPMVELKDAINQAASRDLNSGNEVTQNQMGGVSSSSAMT